MIGDRLKELRTGAEMTQPDFAAIVGTSKQYVSRLEAGKNQIPNGELLEGWARYFKVNMRWLVSGKGPKHPAENAHAIGESTPLDYVVRVAAGEETAKSPSDIVKQLAGLLTSLPIAEREAASGLLAILAKTPDNESIPAALASILSNSGKTKS